MDRDGLTVVVGRGIAEEVRSVEHEDSCRAPSWITSTMEPRLEDADHDLDDGEAVCHNCGVRSEVLDRDDARSIVVDKRGSGDLAEYVKDKNPGEFLTNDLEPDPANDVATAMKLSMA
ncbi:MAG: hypothetical protein SVU88_02285 [Candidatus Nanohaloarchaea archaeon]|nr:hypothetical protein [Candidatus Nanohaloarchaea archaeon]